MLYVKYLIINGVFIVVISIYIIYLYIIGIYEEKIWLNDKVYYRIRIRS